MLAQIFLGHSPNRCRVCLEGGEPSLLLAFGDVQEELDDDNALIAQLPFERADVIEPLTQLFPFHQARNSVGPHPAVPAPVENSQPPASRRPLPKAPQEWIKLIFL